MISLARATLAHEWRRYLAAVLAITFAGLLIVVQLALLLGLFGSVAVVVDRSGADLWIGFRNTQSVDLGRALVRGSDALAWSHPGVDRVEGYTTAYGDLRRADGVPVSVLLHAMDVSRAGLAFSGLLTQDERALLREPNAILIDAADMRKLGARVGTMVEINGRRARIAGVIEGIRTVGGVNVLASFATARYLAPDIADQIAFYLVRLKPGFDPLAVSAEIADKARFPRYSVWTAPALSMQSQAYWLLESGSGIGSGFASLLALVVGMVITSQTLSGAILASIKEFAALRALGVSRKSLRAIVVEQSLWVGVSGLIVTGLLTLAIAWLGDTLRIAMRFPAWMLAGACVLLLAISMVSGLLALRPLGRADPAALLR
ncbi:ABC transporter permease [Cupriavidus basilensis]|uniref:ABC transporter permease n=1 Tax=Cupriavidus basilensis TaxID=68895 RepID=A0ABT6AXY7_9BURK|nr:ABC transporter permease [Cupriavidus basilensis]MDF3837503.1 ABC transporter permease [Cupriavidus basilensis]